MESRWDSPAPEHVVIERGGDAVGKVNPSNGQDGLPARSASRRKSPDSTSLTAGTSWRTLAEVTGPQAAQKSREPVVVLPGPHTDTGRQGDFSPGERANLC